MSERIKIPAKEPKTRGQDSALKNRKSPSIPSSASPVDQIMFLQRTIGNQAVNRLLRSGIVRPEYRIGHLGKSYDQGAGRVADTVMQMSAPQVCRQSEEGEEEKLQAKELSRQTPRVASDKSTHVLQQETSALKDSIQRFGYEEHESIGDIASGGKWVVLYPGNNEGVKEYKISYGEMVALAGDFFGSLQEMENLAKTESGQRQLDYARSKEGNVKEPPRLTEDERKAVDNRYDELNMKNYSHFSQTTTANNNLKFYLEGHKEAIKKAFKAGPIDESLRIESFYDHFLTDAFTGGHITAPRQAAQEHWGNLYPLFVENFFNHLADHMATHINNNAVFAGTVATIAQIKSSVMNKVSNLASSDVRGYSLGGLISLAIHDWYNKRGIEVVSEVDSSGRQIAGGYKWTAYGEDTKLSERVAQNQKDMVIAAAKIGLQDIYDAYRCPDNNCLLQIGPPYKVEQYVPKADPASRSNIDFKWRFNTVDDLVNNQEMMQAIKELLGPAGRIGKMLLEIAEDKKKLPTDGDFDTNPQAAFKDWLFRLWSNTGQVIKEIADYVPGGTAHHFSTDTMARDYIKQLSAKNMLEKLTTVQMAGLIDKMLVGTTGDDDERAIITVLQTANKKNNVYEVVRQVGGFWRLEENFQGEEWHMLLNVLIEKFFRQLPNKIDYIRWLVDNTTREWGEEACIAIFYACTNPEFITIVKTITREKLDSFLDGAEQRQFDELLRRHSYK